MAMVTIKPMLEVEPTGQCGFMAQSESEGQIMGWGFLGVCSPTPPARRSGNYNVSRREVSGSTILLILEVSMRLILLRCYVKVPQSDNKEVTPISSWIIG